MSTDSIDPGTDPDIVISIGNGVELSYDGYTATVSQCMLLRAYTERRHIHVDLSTYAEPAYLSKRPMWNKDPSCFIITMESSYTDNLDDQSMSYYHLPFSSSIIKEITDPLLYGDVTD